MSGKIRTRRSWPVPEIKCSTNLELEIFAFRELQLHCTHFKMTSELIRYSIALMLTLLYCFRILFFGGGQTCNNKRAKWFGLFQLILFYSLSVSLNWSSSKPLNSKKSPRGKILQKCENVWKSVQKVWKSAETNLPFGCCPFVFIWFLGVQRVGLCVLPSPVLVKLVAAPLHLHSFLLLGSNVFDCFARGLLGIGPPTPPSNPPHPPLSGRFGIDNIGSNQEAMWNQCRIDVASMPNRPRRRGGRGGFKGEVQGVSVPNNALTTVALTLTLWLFFWIGSVAGKQLRLKLSLFCLQSVEVLLTIVDNKDTCMTDIFSN